MDGDCYTRNVQSDLSDRITVNPAQCGGRPCIRGMRIRVSDVLDLLASGLSPQEVVDELPDLEFEDVAAALKFASPLWLAVMTQVAGDDAVSMLPASEQEPDDTA